MSEKDKALVPQDTKAIQQRAETQIKAQRFQWDELLRRVLDPHGRDTRSGEERRYVILVGSSLRTSTGPTWSKAPSGGLKTAGELREALHRILGEERQIYENFADVIRLEDVEFEDNLYLIGSPKVSHFVRHFLNTHRRNNGTLDWFFVRPDLPTSGQGPFYGLLGGNAQRYVPTLDRIRGIGDGTDYGLVVWIPQPVNHGGLIIIMGGCHTSGTAAAGIAITDPSLCSSIFSGEFQRALDAPARGVWAIVRTMAYGFVVDRTSIEVIEVGYV